MNNVERARRMIDNFNRCYRPQPCCCVNNNNGGGTTPTFTIGTVTTGAPGSEAQASITGVAPNFILNLTIPQGDTGTSEITNLANFFALMPGDNTATIAPGTDVSFPNDGFISGESTTRLSDTTFNLAEVGTYQVSFDVPVTEAGQLELTLNGAPLPATVTGRATGTSNIAGTFLVETVVANSVLSVRNPATNTTALTITPSAGGTEPVSANLVIIKLQ